MDNGIYKILFFFYQGISFEPGGIYNALFGLATLRHINAILARRVQQKQEVFVLVYG